LIEKLLGRLTRKLPEVPAATIVNKEEGGKKKKKSTQITSPASK
jgi:hypothetical protein